MKVHLICIDQQNDFTNPNGSLYVKGAYDNVRRTAKMIERLTQAKKLADIHITMDSHRKVDVSHPIWWMSDANVRPEPFTGVSLDAQGDFEFLHYASGTRTKGRTRAQSARARTQEYLKKLIANNRYSHTIWPEHCLIGDEGHNIDPVVSAAVHLWEEQYAVADVVTKGSNPWTEHFSAIQAEVPDPNDPSTQTNTRLVQALESADLVVWVGEALSHCLANTFRDAIANFSSTDFIRKQYIAVDATSSVPGFEKLGDDFLAEVKAKGVNLTTTTDFLT